MFDFKQGRQSGWLVTTEAIFLMTCCLCAVVVVGVVLGAKLMGESADIASAIGSLNQSYAISGLQVGHPTSLVHPTPLANWTGSSFLDEQDFCDTGDDCGLQLCVPPVAPDPEDPVDLCVPIPNDPTEPPVFESCCLADPTNAGCDCDIYTPNSPPHVACCSILGGSTCDPG